MKTAIAYIRISDEDQSNFSIEGQKIQILQYCERYGIRLLTEFVDEGYSAKNFNRPGWGDLRSYLKIHHSKVDYLIIFKYDRLIRNTMQGLSEIEDLEKRFGISIISVTENLGVDPFSPYFFKMRTDLLVYGEFERRVISERVSFGMHTALASGRYLHQAPFGYKNTRDEQNKPIILVHPDQAPVVQGIFSDIVKGFTLSETFQRAKARGLTVKGNSALYRILSNPVYMGYVNVPAYKGQPAEIIKGIHEAIVSPDLWSSVQGRLKKNENHGAKIIKEELPLRGVITCVNGHVLTGCMSRGRHGGLFPYYRCKKCSSHQTLSGIKAHEDLKSALKEMSLPDNLQEILLKKVQEQFELAISERKSKISKLKAEIADLEFKLANVQDAFFSRTIDTATYKTGSARYQMAMDQKRSELSLLSTDHQSLAALFERALPDLGKLDLVYSSAPVLDKIALIRTIFPRGLTRTRDVWQTPFIPSIFFQSPRLSRFLEIKRSETDGFTPVSGPGGGRTRVQTRNF